ncbi:helix-turn-helix domain-containing protein [Flavobacterium selenitireducens]|uniref:helix-turn-helix domain-containing protein n=1 Tax=Flavobacterium selenitireducens TaxID=2722704 RepID=UPI00168AB7EA|nr:helix-turn-helix domain-containing protein [Flavobacterium selenitireducens]MBD3581528.1 helix-turn-helix domain-containing protein [Flavobacterium selenitireducens]
MKQPALGKKIAFLRAEKGMTQAELADLCNVTVRTVQRIEAAEVEPRSFTVKALFAALGQQAYATVPEGEGRPRSKWSEMLADLFNLKTNTMKKIAILSSPILLAIGVFLTVSSSGFAQNKKVEKALAETNDDFMKAFNSGKFEAVKAIYLENACSVPAISQEICGSDNIVAYFQTLHKGGFRFTDFKSKSVNITDTVAIDKGIWAGSAEGQKISGTYLTQWRLKDGVWKIENESSNVGADASPN